MGKKSLLVGLALLCGIAAAAWGYSLFTIPQSTLNLSPYQVFVGAVVVPIVAVWNFLAAAPFAAEMLVLLLALISVSLWRRKEWEGWFVLAVGVAFVMLWAHHNPTTVATLTSYWELGPARPQPSNFYCASTQSVVATPTTWTYVDNGSCRLDITGFSGYLSFMTRDGSIYRHISEAGLNGVNQVMWIKSDDGYTHRVSIQKFP